MPAADGAVLLVGFTLIVGFGFLSVLAIIAAAGAIYVWQSKHGASATGDGAAEVVTVQDSPANQQLQIQPAPPRPRLPSAPGTFPNTRASWGPGGQPLLVEGVYEWLQQQPPPGIGVPPAFSNGEQAPGGCHLHTVSASSPPSSRCAIVEIEESPTVKAKHGRSPGPSLPSGEQVQHGYASQLACLFGGDIAVHCENISILIDAFALGVEDICYCSLCLDQIANAEQFSRQQSRCPQGLLAQVWVVALARFVYEVQGLQNAVKEEHLTIPCETWQLDVSKFTKEVQACEAGFKRKHGKMLREAFEDQKLRQDAVLQTKQRLLSLAPVVSKPCSSSRCPLRGCSSKLPHPNGRTHGAKRKALTDISNAPDAPHSAASHQAVGKRLAIAASAADGGDSSCVTGTAAPRKRRKALTA